MSLSEKFKIIIPPQDIACNPEVLLHIAQGNKESFDALYKNYCKKVFDYAMLLLNNEAAAEDIVQEVFLKIWKNKEIMVSVKDFNAYLNRMIRNQVNDHWRKLNTEKQCLQNYQSKQPALQVPDDSKELSFAINRAINQLPAKQKLVYKLRKEENWKREKIASVLNISPNTVKEHLQKALRFVKSAMEEAINS